MEERAKFSGKSYIPRPQAILRRGRIDLKKVSFFSQYWGLSVPLGSTSRDSTNFRLKILKRRSCSILNVYKRLPPCHHSLNNTTIYIVLILH
jgi:hypothetical protein